MRAALLGVLLIGACVTTDDPVITVPEAQHVTETGLTSYEVSTSRDDEVDICGLAAALPGDNVCSLVCDPDAFTARLVGDGMSGGRCYQLRCQLTADTTVSVGVCLP